MLKPKSSQSTGCIHIQQKKPEKFKQSLSTRKLMASVFWDWEGMLMQQGATMTSEVYCETLKKSV
jgi:hypothetical protein